MMTFDVNNGGILKASQEEHDGAVYVKSGDGTRYTISNGDMVMLFNLYRYVKEYDIQNDFINPLGKNKD